MNYWIIIACVLCIILPVIILLASRRRISALRKLSKNKMLENMERLLGAIESHIFITELETDKILFANEKLIKDFGLNDSIIGEMCWKAFMSYSQRCSFCPKNKPGFNTGESVTWEFQHPLTGRHHRIISRVIDWPDGSKVFMEQTDDITELKELIEKMQDADERMQLMLDSSPLGVMLIDEYYNIIDCNQEALDMFGVSDKGEYIAKFFEFSPERQPNGELSYDLSRKYVWMTLEGNYNQFEWIHKKQNGELMPCEITLVRSVYKEQTVVVVHIRDLRELKEMIAEIEKTQEKLRLARDAAEDANRAKSLFLANMSHEIRTPMNSIIGLSELAMNDDISAQTREYLSKIMRSAEWLLSIINNILDISKIESGKMELEHIPFSLQDIFAHCRTVTLPKAEEKGLSLFICNEPACTAEGRPFIGKKLLGDPVKLCQTLLNMLSNAVKFTNTGSVKLSAYVMELNDTDAVLRFEIKDTGIGMSAEHAARVFEPFVQADNSITRRYGGTGLGLPITKSIIEMMGGTLEVESEPGAGSKFSFNMRFNIINDDVTAPSEIFTPEVIEKPDFEGEVLVFEDNDINQQVICEHLSRVGLKSVVAENGQEGIDIITKRIQDGKKPGMQSMPFDLIFMDIHMPVMDGLEAADRIIGMGVKTPIVAMTANIMTSDIELYKTRGMPDYLGKPFKAQELWKCLMKYFSPVSRSSVDERSQIDDEENMLRLLKMSFAKYNRNRYTEIMQAAESGDAKLAHRLAHTLKGNAGQISETRLQEAAAVAEKIFATGETRLTEEQRGILETELKSVLEKLAPPAAS